MSDGQLWTIPALDPGDYSDFEASSFESIHVVASKAVLLAQLCKSNDADGNRFSDPFMLIVPPVKQYSNDYTFSTLTTLFEGEEFIHYLNVIVETERLGGILLDGVPFRDYVLERDWKEVLRNNSDINQPTYSVATVKLDSGVHMLRHLDSSVFFMSMIYGLKFQESYAHSLGQKMAAIPHACSKSFLFFSDHFDNDCDQRFDEELADGIDNDNDGLIDEDVRLNITYEELHVTTESDMLVTTDIDETTAILRSLEITENGLWITEGSEAELATSSKSPPDSNIRPSMPKITTWKIPIDDKTFASVDQLPTSTVKDVIIVPTDSNAHPSTVSKTAPTGTNTESKVSRLTRIISAITRGTTTTTPSPKPEQKSTPIAVVTDQDRTSPRPPSEPKPSAHRFSRPISSISTIYSFSETSERKRERRPTSISKSATTPSPVSSIPVSPGTYLKMPATEDKSTQGPTSTTSHQLSYSTSILKGEEEPQDPEGPRPGSTDARPTYQHLFSYDATTRKTTRTTLLSSTIATSCKGMGCVSEGQATFKTIILNQNTKPKQGTTVFPISTTGFEGGEKTVASTSTEGVEKNTKEVFAQQTEYAADMDENISSRGEITVEDEDGSGEFVGRTEALSPHASRFTSPVKLPEPRTLKLQVATTQNSPLAARSSSSKGKNKWLIIGLPILASLGCIGVATWCLYCCIIPWWKRNKAKISGKVTPMSSMARLPPVGCEHPHSKDDTSAGIDDGDDYPLTNIDCEMDRTNIVKYPDSDKVCNPSRAGTPDGHDSHTSTVHDSVNKKNSEQPFKINRVGTEGIADNDSGKRMPTLDEKEHDNVVDCSKGPNLKPGSKVLPTVQTTNSALLVASGHALASSLADRIVENKPKSATSIPQHTAKKTPVKKTHAVAAMELGTHQSLDSRKPEQSKRPVIEPPPEEEYHRELQGYNDFIVHIPFSTARRMKFYHY